LKTIIMAKGYADGSATIRLDRSHVCGEAEGLRPVIR